MNRISIIDVDLGPLDASVANWFDYLIRNPKFRKIDRIFTGDCIHRLKNRSLLMKVNRISVFGIIFCVMDAFAMLKSSSLLRLEIENFEKYTTCSSAGAFIDPPIEFRSHKWLNWTNVCFDFQTCCFSASLSFQHDRSKHSHYRSKCWLLQQYTQLNLQFIFHSG